MRPVSALWIGLLLWTACDSPIEPEPAAVPALLNLREGIVRVVESDSAQLVAEVRDADGRLLDVSDVEWSSADAEIATVDARGQLRALQPGWTLVHAVRGALRDSAWVAVSQRYRSVSTGRGFACGITTADHMYCWGEGWGMDMSGVGRWDTPLFFIDDAAQVVTAWDHACRLTIVQTVYCWGRDQYGQRGDGGGTSFGGASLVTTPEPLTMLSSSQYHTCGVAASERVYCWGINDTGELGTWPDNFVNPAPCSYPCRRAPVEVPVMRLRTVSAGMEHTCGLDAQGVAFCWGANESGQLGIGTVGDTLAPRAVNTSLRFKSIDAGYRQTCGIDTSDGLYCWGNGVTLPTRIEPTSQFKYVSAFIGMCAITTGGRLYCVQDGAMTPLAPGVSFTSVSVNSDSSCALSDAGAIYCWGRPSGTGLPARNFPIMIAPPGPVPAVVS